MYGVAMQPSLTHFYWLHEPSSVLYSNYVIITIKRNERINRVLAKKGAMHPSSTYINIVYISTVYKPNKFVMRCGNYDGKHMCFHALLPKHCDWLAKMQLRFIRDHIVSHATASSEWGSCGTCVRAVAWNGCMISFVFFYIYSKLFGSVALSLTHTLCLHKMHN